MTPNESGGVDVALMRRLCDLNDRKRSQTKALDATRGELERTKQEVYQQMLDSSLSTLGFTDRKFTDKDMDLQAEEEDIAKEEERKPILLEPTGEPYLRSTIFFKQDNYIGYEDKDVFHSVLEALGLGELRKVHSRTLSSWFKNEKPPQFERQDGERLDAYKARIATTLGLKIDFGTGIGIRNK